VEFTSAKQQLRHLAKPTHFLSRLKGNGQRKQEKCKKLRKLKENSGGGGNTPTKQVYLQVPDFKYSSAFNFQEASKSLSEDQIL